MPRKAKGNYSIGWGPCHSCKKTCMGLWFSALGQEQPCPLRPVGQSPTRYISVFLCVCSCVCVICHSTFQRKEYIIFFKKGGRDWKFWDVWCYSFKFSILSYLEKETEIESPPKVVVGQAKSGAESTSQGSHTGDRDPTTWTIISTHQDSIGKKL